MKVHQLWAADETYEKHRIPGMLVTDRGTLLVYHEARVQAGDWGQMDIIMQRSEDGGEVFGKEIILAKGTNEHRTVNNPVMVQDQNGRLHFLYCEDYATNNGRVLHRCSDDDGLKWTEPEDITYATLPEYRNAFALGPGHGICTPCGDLVIPVWMIPKRYECPISSHCPSEIATIYSTDCGVSWKMGEVIKQTVELFSPNETEIAVLENGEIYLNTRLGMVNHRARAYSPTGYSAWRGFEADKSLHDPRCFGSVATIKPEGKPFTLLFANCADKCRRDNVTVKGSFDNGRTWRIGCVLDADMGGYVEMAVDHQKGNIYVLYEKNWGERCDLVTLKYEELKELPAG